MTQQQNRPPTPSNEELYNIITQIQAANQKRINALSIEEQAVFAQQENAWKRKLLSLLLEEFRQRASRARWWRDSPQMRDLEASYSADLGMQDPLTSLVLHGFTFVLEKIPTLNVDPTKPIVNLLWIIATRGIADEYRQIYKSDPRRRKHSSQDGNPIFGTPDAQAWPSPWQHVTSSGYPWNSDDLGIDYESLPDPEHADDMQSVINVLYARELWLRIEPFFEQIEEVNRRIVNMRCHEGLPYDLIARVLGPDWSEGRVKMRYHRTLEELKMLLQRQILLEKDD